MCNCQMEHLSVSEFSGQFLTHTPESSLIAYKDFALHEVNPNNGLGIIYFDFDPNVFLKILQVLPVSEVAYFI